MQLSHYELLLAAEREHGLQIFADWSDDIPKETTVPPTGSRSLCEVWSPEGGVFTPLPQVPRVGTTFVSPNPSSALSREHKGRVFSYEEGYFGETCRPHERKRERKLDLCDVPEVDSQLALTHVTQCTFKSGNRDLWVNRVDDEGIHLSSLGKGTQWVGKKRIRIRKTSNE